MILKNFMPGVDVVAGDMNVIVFSFFLINAH